MIALSGRGPAAAMFFLALTLCASTTTGAQHGSVPAPPPRSYTTAPVEAARVPWWRADLLTLVAGLERVHPRPYQRTAEADFHRAVATLHDSIPWMAEHEVVVAFARLLALVGDGHTSLPLYFAPGVGFHVLPYRLGIYEDGIHVEAADRRHGNLVGRQVIAIGGVPVSDVLARVVPLISRDNDNWIGAVAPHLFNRIEVLHAVGVAPDLEGVDLTVALGSGRHTEYVRPLDQPLSPPMGLPFLPAYTNDWVDVRDAASTPPPLYQRRYDDSYWWEYVPEKDLLYIKFDQVLDRPEGATALDTFREALAFARTKRPGRSVIDLRNNTGGNGSLLPPLLREIVRAREIDRPGALFLVIGRRTFSAAQMMTGWMELFTSAVLVGEPSSASYNGYAGHEFVRLPNSGIVLAISPDYYQMGTSPRDNRQQATPRLAAVPTFEGYRANRDPALEVILAYRPDDFAQDVIAALTAGDTSRALAVVHAHDADPVHRYHRSTSRLNALGYSLLRAGRSEVALGVFLLNVRANPDYANGWDSLGEAYAGMSRTEDAVAAFQQALRLDPGFPTSQEWLRRLGGTEPRRAGGGPGLDAGHTAANPVMHGAPSSVSDRLQPYVGAYRVVPGGTMSLSRFVHGENTVHLFTDFTGGWRGVLQPAAGDTFDLLPAGGAAATGRPRVVLARDAQGGSVLELHTQAGPPRSGARIALRTEAVRFESDTVTLAGEIVLPPGTGRHPGIVFVHGSGPATRNDYREWSYFFAANGLAALIYDKRGAGESTGDYTRATFLDLAEDARAAVRTLRDRSDIDPDHVGLSGGSQGAWVSPIAENRDGPLAFLILTGGGPITPATQEIYRRTRIVQDSGHTAAEIAAARALVTLYFDYLGSGGDDAGLARLVSDAWDRHSAATWFPLLDLPSRDPTADPWPEGRKRFARELHFDPTPFTAAVKTPSLAVLGAEDQGFPTEATAAAYRATVPADLLTVWIIPGVDHGFWVRDKPTQGRHQSPALFEGMLAWIRSRLR